jgi:RNA recognition motif-containing protein
MNKKLFVGSLPYSTDNSQLEELFAEFGSVSSAKVITDRFSGQSKGFAFVEMVNANDAANAMRSLNGRDFNGRQLIVSEAKERQ